MAFETLRNSVTRAMGNLAPEAYFPLMQFANKHLHIDMEKSMRDDIMQLAKKYITLNKDGKIAKSVLSSLDSAIKYVQTSIAKKSPKASANYFNFVKDAYAKEVVNKFFASQANKSKFVEATLAYSNDTFVKSVLGKLSKNNIKLDQNTFESLKAALTKLVKENDNPNLVVKNIPNFKNVLMSMPEDARRVILESTLQRNHVTEDLDAKLKSKTPAQLVSDFQAKIYNGSMRAIKKNQAREIYSNDGLIERVIPATVRGLNDVSKSVVENIAMLGDNSKPEDLFNFEVASNARHNSQYAVGHTGGSNRSSTALTDIAMYFASKHGLKNGTPKSTWVMVYESSKGINTTELVDKNVNWTEFEFASPELKTSRFLGAVKFELDPKKTDGKNIAFKATDGFVAPRVHDGNYRKEGIEGDIKNFLDLAKHFDKPSASPKPKTEFKLTKNDKVLSNKRSFFQTLVDKLGLSSNKKQYNVERKKQLSFVQHETPEQKKKRLAKEKDDLAFFHAFAEKLDAGKDVKSMLPSFNSRIQSFSFEQRKAVESELNKALKMK